ncbi:LysR family transcriptional regulator [Salinarimonas soli]|uniref:LysR family transcriptional regulator n=1 Tax=Salinarimonas soli TaxID=1638099 RepID=A0A5B2VEZ4_9HYPH|nr:LysR family transcriptional regulator [Salinarimonas soli]KAA2238133.1 LysR family transcriptional regulator [Salinarimonas soli]
MDVRQLRHFLAVAETLHFGRAAERLGMTQPPLSQSIIALERSLGAPLFARTRRSVALTALGEQWLPHVKGALAGIDGLDAVARRLRDGTAGHLDLSFVTTADYGLLPTLVRRYAALHPDVEIRLKEATSDVQIADLLAGRGHVGIVIPPGEGLPEPLGYRRLGSERLVAAIPETWLAEGRLALDDERLASAALIGAPLIIFPRRIAPAFHDLVTGFYAAHGGHARVVQEAIQMQTIISLVSAGIGIALVPESLRNLARTGVRYVDLVDAAPRLETGLVWRKQDDTPTLRRFLAIAADPEVEGPAV